MSGRRFAVESGRACASDRGSGGLGLAEGIVLKLFFHVVDMSERGGNGVAPAL